MKTKSHTLSPPGFWRAVRLLLKAARRRSVGRARRQQQLLQNRTGKKTNTLAKFGSVTVAFLMAFVNGAAAYIVQSVVSAGQRVEAEYHGKIVVQKGFLIGLRNIKEFSLTSSAEEARRYFDDLCKYEARYRALWFGGSEEEYKKLLQEAVLANDESKFIEDSGISALAASKALPAMLGSIVLFWWLVMMICQGEGLELDLQRRRHPMWEWLFSHPVSPGAIFLAEMLSPIAANPAYLTGPIFCGILYGIIYGLTSGIVATILAGIPITIATACVGKAFDIGIMLRFPPRSRGAMIGLKSWIGYISMMMFMPVAFVISNKVGVIGNFMHPLATALPWPWLGWFVGARSDGSFSLTLGIVTCWLFALVMITGAVWYSVWGAHRGLAGNFGRTDVTPSMTGAARKLRFTNNPLYQKELLWFIRDRSAIVQTILIPLSIAGIQAFNFRGFLYTAQNAWNYLAGIAIMIGTYFLWILGPRSLASEGPALWLTHTWPRGIEELLKSKARLWSFVATGMVALIFAYAIIRFPQDMWKILLVGIGWIAFGRSMAEKSVTLVSTPSSSGEPEPIPRGRQWAASLGMLTFAIGVLSQQWHIAIMGIVYSWVTAAAMWQNFRARLPFLYDPWSEQPPPPPTIMHAMIAIAALVEGGAILIGLALLLFGKNNLTMTQPAVYGICAAIVVIIVSKFLSDRGVELSKVLHWSRDAGIQQEDLPWWRVDGVGRGRFIVSMGIGALAGLLLALFARGYMTIMFQFPKIAEMIRQSNEEMAKAPGLKLSLGICAVLIAPFAEEYLFRGLLYRSLDREWGGWRAVIASAGLFTVYHPALAWPPVCLVGIANALIFKKTGKLAPAVLLHLVYNAILFVT